MFGPLYLSGNFFPMKKTLLTPIQILRMALAVEIMVKPATRKPSGPQAPAAIGIQPRVVAEPLSRRRAPMLHHRIGNVTLRAPIAATIAS